MKYKMLSALTAFSMLTISSANAENTEISIQKDSIAMSYTADDIVIIQSYKKNDNITLLPISATVLGEKSIKNRNITNIKDIGTIVPNLHITDYGSTAVTTAFMRGVGSNTNSPSVGLIVDGVPYFDRSTFDFNMKDINRIEVLRGPQGTIYGRNTMGGIINVYTKSPLQYKETNVRMSVSKFDTYDMGFSRYGQLADNFGYGISANYYHTRGHLINTFNSRPADPKDAFSGRLRLGWKPTEQWYVDFTSAYEYLDEGGWPYQSLDKETGGVKPINYDQPSNFRRNMSNNGLNVKFDNGTVEFNSQTSFQYFDGKQRIDIDYIDQNWTNALYEHSQRMLSQDFTLKSVTNNNYQWLFGTFLFDQNLHANDYSIVTMRGLNYTDLNKVKTPRRGVAFYHQSVYNNLFVKGLSATVGLRFDIERVANNAKLSQLKNVIWTQTGEANNHKTFYQFTPKFALQYDFNKHNMVYASATRGYKAGGYNTIFSDAVIQDVGEIKYEYKPEYSWSYEVGAKTNLFDNILGLNVSLFYIDWKDQQVFEYVIAKTNGQLTYNAAKSASKGLEASIVVRPIKHLTFSANYGYTHAKYKDYSKGLNSKGEEVIYTSNFLPLVPRHTLSLDANYVIPFVKANSLFDKIILNAQYNGTGNIYWRDDNLKQQKYYGTLNALVSVIKGGISVDFWAKNITDTNYNAMYLESMMGSFVQKGRPFNAGVSVNVKF